MLRERKLKNKWLEGFYGVFKDGLFLTNQPPFTSYNVEFFYVDKKLGLKDANRIAYAKLSKFSFVRVPAYVHYLPEHNLNVYHSHAFVYVFFTNL